MPGDSPSVLAGASTPRDPSAVRLSVTQRVTALWSALFVAALIAFAAFASAFDARSAQMTLDQRLLAEAAVAATSLEGGSVGIDADLLRVTLAGSALVLFRGSTLIQILGGRPAPAALAIAASLAPDVPVTIPGTEPYRVVAHDVESSTLRVAAFAAEDPVSEEVERTQRTFFAVGIPLVALAIVAGFFLARRSLAPIDRLTRTAADVARTKLFSMRFTVATQDELGRLGATFNAMLASLEETYERERAFIGDVSHELRGPLTAIAGEAQLALQESDDSARQRDALRRIDAQTRALRAVIDDLLALARADAGALGSGTSEVGEAVAEAANAIRTQFPRVALTVELQSDPIAVGIPGPLAVHLFTNLIRNAAQAARTSVAVRVAGDGADALVSIDDDGPGIPLEARGRVFRRFERGAQGARGVGTGLGLAIASALAAIGQGTIAVGDAPSGGARLSVRLPSRV